MTIKKDNMTLSISMKPEWSIISENEKKISAFLEEKGMNADIVESAILGAGELIENAIKYGEGIGSSGNIECRITADKDRMTIKVSNGIKSAEDMAAAIEHIEKIRNSSSVEKLYTGRLKELMETERPDMSRLGLYRIAYEGGFRINYTEIGGILTVTADKKI